MINNIVLAGNVVKDPESRTTTAGKNVSRLRLAVNNPLNDKEVLFIDVEVWDKQSEFISKHVKKGSSVSATGRLKMDEWLDKEGKKQSKYLVVATQVNFIGTKKKEASEDGPSGGAGSGVGIQSDEFDDAAFAAAAGIKG
jgi:single-strand DNA-binding protein